jgi:hypothetical protein
VPHIEVLNNHLLPTVRSKRRELLARGVLLQHDNARPYTARATIATIQGLHFEGLLHLPNSSDLAQSYYHMFGPLKEAMELKKFHSDEEEVQQAVQEWLCR